MRRKTFPNRTEETLVLPHEIMLLQAKIEQGVAENQQATADIANAVENGNVWHDNAEYDEVIERMGNIDGRYAPIATMIRRCVIIDYPSPASMPVQIGSLVEITQGRSSFPIAVVGQTLAGSEEYNTRWALGNHDPDELLVVSTSAPLAVAIMGLEAGKEISYQNGQRQFDVTVHSVNQIWMRESFADLVATELTVGESRNPQITHSEWHEHN